jgi:hypothetical protein
MKKTKKKPSLLTKRDFFNFEQMEWALKQNEDDSVSQACLRYGYGNMPEEDLLEPCQLALIALCKDNPMLNADEFSTWWQDVVDDDEIFRFDKVMLQVVNEVRLIFDKKRQGWVEKKY